jgi:hypothetical protein
MSVVEYLMWYIAAVCMSLYTYKYISGKVTVRGLILVLLVSTIAPVVFMFSLILTLVHRITENEPIPLPNSFKPSLERASQFFKKELF